MKVPYRRLTTSYKVSGTKNFRLASSKLLGFFGTNLQNPSDSLMECVIPEDDYIFLQPDQRGAEALVVAYEAPDGRFRQLFQLGIKPHSYMALQIFTNKFKGPYDAARYKAIYPKDFKALPECSELLKAIGKSKREYDLGKRVIHAKNFDMGPRTFQVNTLEESEGTINLTYQEAKSFLQTHEATFPEILEYQQNIREELARGRILRNLFGFPRYFGGLWCSNLLRDAYAFKPQSTVGTITNIAVTSMTEYIKKQSLPWFVLNNKHDSFLMEVPDTAEHKEHARTKAKELIEQHLTSSKGEQFQMKCGISWGHNWGKYSDENPTGMKEEE